jgi:hypothetical protein
MPRGRPRIHSTSYRGITIPNELECACCHEHKKTNALAFQAAFERWETKNGDSTPQIYIETYLCRSCRSGSNKGDGKPKVKAAKASAVAIPLNSGGRVNLDAIKMRPVSDIVKPYKYGYMIHGKPVVAVFDRGDVGINLNVSHYADIVYDFSNNVCVKFMENGKELYELNPSQVAHARAMFEEAIIVYGNYDLLQVTKELIKEEKV